MAHTTAGTAAPATTATADTTPSSAVADPRRLWFGADAVVTGLNALAYVAAAPLLADLLGGSAVTWRWLGLSLAVYAVGVGAYARSGLRPLFGWDIVVLNALWSVASLEVAIAGGLDLEPVGRGWTVAQAVVVAALAVLQARSLRARRSGGRS